MKLSDKVDYTNKLTDKMAKDGLIDKTEDGFIAFTKYGKAAFEVLATIIVLVDQVTSKEGKKRNGKHNN